MWSLEVIIALNEKIKEEHNSKKKKENAKK